MELQHAKRRVTTSYSVQLQKRNTKRDIVAIIKTKLFLNNFNLKSYPGLLLNQPPKLFGLLYLFSSIPGVDCFFTCSSTFFFYPFMIPSGSGSRCLLTRIQNFIIKVFLKNTWLMNWSSLHTLCLSQTKAILLWSSALCGCIKHRNWTPQLFYLACILSK